MDAHAARAFRCVCPCGTLRRFFDGPCMPLVSSMTRRQLLICALFASVAQAQAAAPERGAARATAAPLAETPVIDGDVIGDPAWRGMPAIQGFWPAILQPMRPPAARHGWNRTPFLLPRDGQ